MITVKIRTRIIIGFLLIAGAGFYYLTNWILHDLRPHYLKSMEESLVDISTLLSSLVAQDMINDTNITDNLRIAFQDAYKRTLSAKIYDHVKKEMNIRVYMTDETGIVLFDSDSGKDEGRDFSRWNDVYLTLQGKYGARSTREDDNDPTSSWLYVGSPIVAHTKIAGVLSVGKPAKSINLFVVHAKNKIIIAGIIASICVIILGIFLSAWIAWPIKKLTDYARAIRDGTNPQLPQLGTFSQGGHSEIGIMGAALEEMRDALEGKKYIENYVQPLTHEIKSPLSAIKSAAELLNEEMPRDKQQQFIKNIQTETGRIQNLIDRLLELSLLETRKGLKDIEQIEIPLLLKEIIESLKPISDTKSIKISLTSDAGFLIKGEKFLIRQALVNIMQNSLDFSPTGSEIKIRLQSETPFLSILIEDNGSGIPDYALDKIFNRFYSLNRPDTKRKSTGLGLSFVKEVATLHHGSIHIANRPGGGVTAKISLPLL